MVIGYKAVLDRIDKNIEMQVNEAEVAIDTAIQQVLSGKLSAQWTARPGLTVTVQVKLTFWMTQEVKAKLMARYLCPGVGWKEMKIREGNQNYQHTVELVPDVEAARSGKLYRDFANESELAGVEFD